MNRAPKSRKNDLVVQEMDGEILIYDLSDNKAFSLNETSALVWELCDGNNSISEISQELSKKLKANTNEELVWLALDQLKKEKLIENEEIVPASFEGLSRREVIRKIGLGSMIALPIVSSIVAPTSVSAGSCAGAMTITENQPCSSSCQCVGRPNGLGGFFTATCCDQGPGDNRMICREVPGSAICYP